MDIVQVATGNTTGNTVSATFDTDRDRGRWMEIILHVKAASARGANDGVVELWRRWDDESERTKMFEQFDADIAPPQGGPNGWARGYIMGAANGASTDGKRMNWLLDDFRVYSSPIIPGYGE